MPQPLRQAIRLLVTHWYENRSAVVLGDDANATPLGYRELVAPYRQVGAVLSRRGASEAGRLRLRLVLERATSMPDGAGGTMLDWDEIATLPADMTPMQGK